MSTYPYRKPGKAGEPITLTIDGHIARRIRELHGQSSLGEEYGGRTSVQKWCIEIIAAFLADRRSGIVPRERGRYWNHNPEHTYEEA